MESSIVTFRELLRCGTPATSVRRMARHLKGLLGQGSLPIWLYRALLLGDTGDELLD